MRSTVQKPLYTNVSILYTMSRAEMAGYVTQPITKAQYDDARQKLAAMPIKQMVSPDAALALVLGGNPFAGWFDADDRDDESVMRRRELYWELIMFESKWLRDDKSREYLETFEEVLSGYVQGHMPTLNPLQAAEYVHEITCDILSNQ
jgi:hypothetical protein|nr:MAG TPA: hypothetical protein [Caudoviricetes sp.]